MSSVSMRGYGEKYLEHVPQYKISSISVENAPSFDLPIPKMHFIKVPMRCDLLVVLNIEILLSHDDLLGILSLDDAILIRTILRVEWRGTRRRR